MSTKKALDVLQIIERAKLALEIKTDTELANMLGKKQNSISAWKRRKKIDLPALITLCADVNTNWLIYGKGEMYGSDAKDPATQRLLLLLEDMTEEQKRDVLRYAQKEKLFEDLMKERKLA